MKVKLVQHVLDAVGLIDCEFHKTLPKKFPFGRRAFKTEEVSLGT